MKSAFLRPHTHTHTHVKLLSVPFSCRRGPAVCDAVGKSRNLQGGVMAEHEHSDIGHTYAPTHMQQTESKAIHTFAI